MPPAIELEHVLDGRHIDGVDPRDCFERRSYLIELFARKLTLIPENTTDLTIRFPALPIESVEPLLEKLSALPQLHALCFEHVRLYHRVKNTDFVGQAFDSLLRLIPTHERLACIKFSHMRIRREEARLLSALLSNDDAAISSLILEDCDYGFRASACVGRLLFSAACSRDLRHLGIIGAEFNMLKVLGEFFGPAAHSRRRYDWTLDLSRSLMGEDKLFAKLKNEDQGKIEQALPILMRRVETLRLDEAGGPIIFFMLLHDHSLRHFHCEHYYSLSDFCRLDKPCDTHGAYNREINPYQPTGLVRVRRDILDMLTTGDEIHVFTNDGPAACYHWYHSNRLRMGRHVPVVLQDQFALLLAERNGMPRRRRQQAVEAGEEKGL